MADQTINLHPGINLVIGENGQGKTNLIEAINILGHAKSFRTSKSAELVRWDHIETSVFGEVIGRYDPQGSNTLGVAVNRGRKTAYIDGNRINALSDFIGHCFFVTFSPTDLNLVKGPAGERRRFLDKTAVDLDRTAVNDLIEYKKAHRSKNAVLRTNTNLSQSEILKIVEPWNMLMARFSFRIVSERLALAKTLNESVKRKYELFSGGREKVEVSLKSQLLKDEWDFSEEGFLSCIESWTKREISAGKSLAGCHRDDLVVSIAGRDSRAYASQGQTRSIVLALKFAVMDFIQQKHSVVPIVLLDDVDSELDSRRREVLFGLIENGERQVVITGTELLLNKSGITSSNVMQVKDGLVCQI